MRVYTKYFTDSIDQMRYDLYSDVYEWFSILMGFVGIVAGFSTGPAGWVAIVSGYGGALVTFAGLTSKGYATAKRLDLSGNAAKYVEGARNIVNNSNSFENYKVELVSGY
ncbi:hypothetical protein [Brevibacillus borstelensis]|uniref:hypothetical protein n=1 Tax=Brevibacillus borstelensis TaxID=45462 RepID=UPI0012F709DB|nr:hypothetical protein [Brevibacillus borstelensis]